MSQEATFKIENCRVWHGTDGNIHIAPLAGVLIPEYLGCAFDQLDPNAAGIVFHDVEGARTSELMTGEFLILVHGDLDPANEGH